MDRDEDVSLIEDCLDRLGRLGFKAEALEPVGVEAIGRAALRLARRIVDDPPGDFGHPLGFGRVPLTPWELARRRAAVHIWDRSAILDVSEDVHDHCYDFVSACCVGGLEHRVFRPASRSDESTGAKALLYAAGSCDAPGSEGGGPDLSIVEVERFVVEAPRIYAMASEKLHSARPTSKLTVTVQFQSPIVKPQARVYRTYLPPAGQFASASMPFTRARLALALAGWR